jgi:stage II sporulation protein D
MIGRLLFSLTFTFLFSWNIFSQSVKISLFNDKQPVTIVFTVVKGQYKFSGDGEFYSVFQKDQIFYITIDNGTIQIRDQKKLIGNFKNLDFEGIATENTFQLKPVTPSLASREYDDNLQINLRNRRLLLINKVDMEKYLAGVIEAEGGSEAGIEYYKAQAVLIRTFAINNMFKHATEGFNLCDGVHCQAYKGRSSLNDKIYKAARETAGQVLVDADSNLIFSPFHSNCGGLTNPAGNVWQNNLPYLKSIRDPFCTSSRNARWVKEIPFSEWKQFLEEKGIEVQSVKDCLFRQDTRKKYYKVGNNSSVTLRDIRNHWHLKSSFFNVEGRQDSVYLAGRGYGHGVGLCQEGAIEMAKVGYVYMDILFFYFSNVHLADYRTLELNNY